MPMVELYAYLLEKKLVTPIFVKPRDSPPLPGFDPSKKYEHCFGAEGYTLEECTQLRHQIQDLIDNKAPGLKALEAALPNPIIISPKMFSLVPNLQNQEGVVIRMPKPFPYKDSHRVLWKYDVTLISTQTEKEEVHREALLKLLKETHFITGITDSSFEGMVSLVLATNQVSFSDDEFPLKASFHSLEVVSMIYNASEPKFGWPATILMVAKEIFKFGYKLGQSLRAVGRESPTFVELSDKRKIRFGVQTHS
ncbi:hypothetical protein SO802_026441 [Lithocarpus litseifolius]|uniref:Uncharacterized protein n=1 Tax=Lithocarpus litseifolius TaxID=425828 RepID=A0AAW2BZN0_9ROSI